MRVPLGPLLLAVLAGAASLGAQRPSSWVPLQLGAPLVPTAITQLGKVCVYQEPNRVWFFSGFARQWRQAATTAAQPTVRVCNDLAYVLDTGRILAFASYRGTVETLNVSAGATVLNPSSQRNDSILCVQDGATLWTFSCFRGVWTSRTLVSGNAKIATQRHVAVVADGTQLHAMSAFDGTWVSHTAAAAGTAAKADGAWGMVETPTTLYGFSAQRGTWSSAPAPGAGAGSLANEDCIVYWDQFRAIAYTGLRGGFATAPIPGAATVSGEALVAVVQSGTTLQLYSAVHNAWTVTSTNTVAALAVRSHLVTWNDGGRLSAYSPFTTSIASLPVAVSADASNQAVAAAVDANGTQLYLYSSLTGTWATAPAGSPAALPALIWCGALIRTPSGFTAYSGRSGTFVTLPASATAAKWIDPNSSVMAVEDTAALHVFEPRRETWLSVAKSGTAPLTVRIWRSTLLAIDGATVHGFGSMAGEIESHTLPVPPTEFNANSESLRAGVGTTLVAFGATPDCTTLYQFPEFRRVYTLGSVLEVQVHAAPGAQAWGLLSTPAAAPIAIPPLGELLLDPGFLFVNPLGALPADGRATWRLPIPDLPGLLGLEIGFQALVQPATGTPYLSRLATVGLH
ncbi:MAG: hypothetical protein IT458_00755 [Planctomycetes bacterium]|nr:hypothetical protein [Planctomycetota bacterium]